MFCQDAFHRPIPLSFNLKRLTCHLNGELVLKGVMQIALDFADKRSIISMNCLFHHKPLLFGVFRTISRGFFHNLHFFCFSLDLANNRSIIILSFSSQPLLHITHITFAPVSRAQASPLAGAFLLNEKSQALCRNNAWLVQRKKNLESQ